MQVIARKGTAKLYLKPAALVVTQQAHIDEKYNNVPRRKPERTEKQGTATAAAPAANAVEPPAHREKSKAKDGKPQKTKPISPPLSPRGPPGYMKASSPMSLTRDELKDQVVLYKEQVSFFSLLWKCKGHRFEQLCPWVRHFIYTAPLHPGASWRPDTGMTQVNVILIG